MENTPPEAQEISQGRGFCTPRPERFSDIEQKIGSKDESILIMAACDFKRATVLVWARARDSGVSQFSPATFGSSPASRRILMRSSLPFLEGSSRQPSPQFTLAPALRRSPTASRCPRNIIISSSSSLLLKVPYVGQEGKTNRYLGFTWRLQKWKKATADC